MKKKADKQKEVEALRGELEQTKHLFVDRLREAHGGAGFRAAQDGPRRRRQVPGDQEQPGREGGRGHSGQGLLKGWRA